MAIKTGVFIPKNPEKYKGSYPIRYRSSWELVVFNKFDQHPNVLMWASESVNIPYTNPITNKKTHYVPDLLVVYIDKYNRKHAELIEIKPLRETILERAKTKKDKARLLVNNAKWAAAMEWCKVKGLRFRILTEAQIFEGYN